MKKICPGCGQERDAEKDFRWRYKDRGIRQARCRYCQAESNKTHYQNNKQAYLDRAKSRNDRIIEENQRRLYAYLSTHPVLIVVKLMCVFLSLTMCGERSYVIFPCY